VAHMARHAAEYGVHVGEVRVDFGEAMARMQARVDASRQGLEKWMGAQANITLVRAWGRLAGRSGDDFIVTADGAPLLAPRIYLNTGTRPFVPTIPGLETITHLDNTSLLQLRVLPEHLLVVGGSYIGLEMGQIFRRLGSRVTIIEPGRRIASREDPEVSEAIAAFLVREGVDIRYGAVIEGAAPHGNGVQLRLAGGQTLAGSHVLFATGRVPNSDGLDLASVGVATDARGLVNERRYQWVRWSKTRICARRACAILKRIRFRCSVTSICGLAMQTPCVRSTMPSWRSLVPSQRRHG